MKEKATAQLVTGGMHAAAAHPPGIAYQEVDDELIRATVVAHLIRIGRRPFIGDRIGFSQTLKEGVSDECISESGAINPFKAKPITEKVWCSVTVTQADIDAAHRLINEQRAVYRETKTSQVDI